MKCVVKHFLGHALESNISGLGLILRVSGTWRGAARQCDGSRCHAQQFRFLSFGSVFCVDDFVNI